MLHLLEGGCLQKLFGILHRRFVSPPHLKKTYPIIYLYQSELTDIYLYFGLQSNTPSLFCCSNCLTLAVGSSLSWYLCPFDIPPSLWMCVCVCVCVWGVRVYVCVLSTSLLSGTTTTAGSSCIYLLYQSQINMADFTVTSSIYIPLCAFYTWEFSSADSSPTPGSQCCWRKQRGYSVRLMVLDHD